MVDWDPLDVLAITLICFWFDVPTNGANVVTQSEWVISSNWHEMDKGDG